MSNFKVGDKVRVKADVKNPCGGWGGISHGDVGVITAIHQYGIWSEHVGEDKLIIDFPNHLGWCGYHTEMELVPTKFKVGDTVQLIATKPKYGLGNIRVGDIGTLIKLDSDGEIAVKFPRDWCWIGILSEVILAVEEKEKKEMKKKFVETTTTYAGRTDLKTALKSIFKNQGELYEAVFDVQEDIASSLGWHPEDNEFDTDCDGWTRFLSKKGFVEPINYNGYSKEELKLAIQVLLFQEPTLQKIKLSINDIDLKQLLKSIYAVQGRMYEDLFGIDGASAKNADWHPEDNDFDTDCYGFENFICDKGINSEPKTVKEIDYDLAEIRDIIEKELF